MNISFIIRIITTFLFLISFLNFDNLNSIDENNNINYISNSIEEIKASTQKGSYSFYSSSHNYGSQADVDTGGVVEYQPGFYVSHNYSEGGAFLNFAIGDTVYIDDQAVTIDGYTYIDTDNDYMEDIRANIGYDKICFQTCTGYGSQAIVYYGTVPGAYFGVVETENQEYTPEDTAYNEEAAALDNEYEEWSAEYNAAYEQYEQATSGRDVNELAAAFKRLREAEEWGEDLGKRVEAHNANY